MRASAGQGVTIQVESVRVDMSVIPVRVFAKEPRMYNSPAVEITIIVKMDLFALGHRMGKRIVIKPVTILSMHSVRITQSVWRSTQIRVYVILVGMYPLVGIVQMPIVRKGLSV